MNYQEYCQFISSYAHNALEDIQENASFRDDLGIDSLQMVNLVVGLSEKFGVGIQALTDSNDFSTVRKLYQAFTKEAIR